MGWYSRIYRFSSLGLQQHIRLYYNGRFYTCKYTYLKYIQYSFINTTFSYVLGWSVVMDGILLSWIFKNDLNKLLTEMDRRTGVWTSHKLFCALIEKLKYKIKKKASMSLQNVLFPRETPIDRISKLYLNFVKDMCR